MTDPLQHDPRTKQQIKDLLYQSIYDPVEAKFKKRLEAIILKNTSLIASSHRSFIYKRKFYNIDDTPKPIKTNRLVVALAPVMDAYLNDLDELNNVELPFVVGFINQVLNSSNNFPDYLRLLPESMHHSLRNLMNTCPCHASSLSEDKINAILAKNQSSIELLKQRMVLNLIN